MFSIAEALSPFRILHAAIGDGLPPGPGRFPYLGLELALSAKENPLGLTMSWVETHGLMFTTRFLGMKQVWMIGPAANQYILVDNAANFSWGLGHLGDLIPFIGAGLLTTDGQVHDRARKLMMPLFSRRKMGGYVVEMVKLAHAAVDRLVVDSEVEIYHFTRELALSVATSVLFGIEASSSMCRTLSHEFEVGLGYFGEFFHMQLFRGPGTPWSRMIRARKRIDRLVYGEIKRRRRIGANGDNILDLLINAADGGDRFNDDEIRDQVMTLLFAGHDTTTATVSWMMSLLGQHAAVYRQLQAELDITLAGQALDVDRLSGGLPYLNKVLAETLRLYPPAWIGPRRAVNDFEYGGYRIPAGTDVAYTSWLSHRLPSVFPDPEMFDPERFTPEKIRALEPGAYVPFGRGKRLCIGQRFGELEVKAIIATLLSRFHFELVPGQHFKPQTVPTISPMYGVRMMVRESKGR